ncbi:MAG TPA: phosphatase PAP2 family protein [Candidatus Kryptonia bacterium]
MKLSELRSLDKLNLIGLAGISIVAIIFHARIEMFLAIVLANITVGVAIIAIVDYDATHHNSIVRFIVQWYSLPLIFLTFKELYLMVHPINPHDLDYLLIGLDKTIFGTDPTAYLDRIATPGLTEFLQICYSSFYLMWVILGFDLLRDRNEEGFIFFLFVLMYGFYTSYVGYFLVPAIGPRFTLHDFSNLDAELPGLVITHFLRDVINSGESIRNVAEAAVHAQRDCFPSGHTEMTIITIAAAIKYRAKSAMVIIPLGAGLIFATVYMRYHYAVDVIAGVLFAILVLSTGGWLRSKLERKRGSEFPEVN